MAIAVVSPLPTEDADYNDVQGDMEFALQGWDSIVLKCGAKTGFKIIVGFNIIVVTSYFTGNL